MTSAPSTAQLRGSCQCGRNQYAIQIPSTPSSLAQIIFDSNANHRLNSASPLFAFLRVPLIWYRSEVFPFFPDETRSTIRRLYAHPTERHIQRSFCGYCGTPLSYWSEEPPSEAEYIQLTLGSLLTEDLQSLQELGLLPDDGEQQETEGVTTATPESTRGLSSRQVTGIPWFDGLISGRQLGNMRTTKTVQQSRGGAGWVEVEIAEWTAEDDERGEGEAYASESSTSTMSKRKRIDADEGNIRVPTSSAT
ncbi:hypothetical protein F5Y14DRAFT_457389 [Nemania sp. NC0429]|nr:hypothetical protein F5Y14DRAFT_457389 [Nemania sp. NC0429]